MKNTFVYTDDMQKGLFAYFWGVINALSKIENDDKLYVNLSKKTSYYDKNYEATDNVWEYYFEQPFLDYDLTNSTSCNFSTFCPNPQSFEFGLDGSGNYSLSTTSKFYKERSILSKNLVKKYFKLKPHVIQKIINFEKENFKENRILGIHYRGGEAFHTGHAKNQNNIMSIEYHISKINENLNTGNYDKLFLITNDKYARDILMNHYSDIIIKYDIDLLCPVGMHLDISWIHNDRNYEKGEFAVIDCILLSKCKKILATSSNLTCLSCVLCENEVEFIDKNIIYC